MEYPDEDPTEIARTHEQQIEFGHAVYELQIALYHLQDDSCVTARAYGAVKTALDNMDELVEAQSLNHPDEELEK